MKVESNLRGQVSLAVSIIDSSQLSESQVDLTPEWISWWMGHYLASHPVQVLLKVNVEFLAENPEFQIVNHEKMKLLRMVGAHGLDGVTVMVVDLKTCQLSLGNSGGVCLDIVGVAGESFNL